MIASTIINVNRPDANTPVIAPMAFWANERPPEDNGDADFRIRIQMEQLFAIQNQKNGTK